MELGSLPPGLRLKEAGPEGAFGIDLLKGEEVLDAHAAGLEGAAAADERIGGLQGIQGKENPGRGRLRAEKHSIGDGQGGAWQPRPEERQKPVKKNSWNGGRYRGAAAEQPRVLQQKTKGWEGPRGARRPPVTVDSWQRQQLSKAKLLPKTEEQKHLSEGGLNGVCGVD